MTERIERLRRESINTDPSISVQRALLETEFYRENEGKFSAPVLRARFFRYLCEKKTIHIGADELIVGERGPGPKAVPTYPELTCHSAEDLRILRSRSMTRFAVTDEDIAAYEREVIPYWTGRSMRDRVFSKVPDVWKTAYEAGLFTEFMEQRAPGHTSLDGIIYQKGMLDFKGDIARAREELDYLLDPEAAGKGEELEAMDIACDAAIIFAERHADLADTMAAGISDPARKAELREIARICRRVPAHAPKSFHEAVQMYWFVHLGTITELNGWDAMNPGHLDQHLTPFYERDIASGILDRERAGELISCFWIKVNNHPAPPKVGVTAEESGTYNDFTNINLGGLNRNGTDGVSEVSYIILEVMDELHLLQPQGNIQVSESTPDEFLDAACTVIRKGYGYPSLFNADMVAAEQVRMGKTIEDAREGGCSGCIETGCFGKEAYILTGYLNVPKVLEIALHNGIDPMTGKRVGMETGDPKDFVTFEELYRAFERQLEYITDIKIRVNNHIERMFASCVPAPFLSVVIADCIKKGRDYYDGGPRYNTGYIQCCGIGTVTDSLSSLKKHVFEDKTVSMDALLRSMADNFQGAESLRLRLRNKTPFFGNDDDAADSIMQRVFESLIAAIEGKPNTKGTEYHVNMLSTTCHIYFGRMLGASPDGRKAHLPISDGTSPAHGSDRKGPTAVVKSLSKMDQVRTGGTLLNQKFMPGALKTDEDMVKFRHLIRTYFSLGGHHIQFNIVDSKTLEAAREHPENHRGLLVRVAGYSDYFVDLDEHHQKEIMARTEQEGF